MPDQYPSFVVFVDAGFLCAAGATAIHYKTHEVSVNANGAVTWFERLWHGGKSTKYDRNPYFTSSSLLRVYWYDAVFAPSDRRYRSQAKYFDALASTPGLHLRLGHLEERTPRWHRAIRQALGKCGVDEADFERHFRLEPEVHQKGVDALITLDLVRLAQQRVYDLALLVAGDRDLAETVRAAQDLGRRVLVAHPKGSGVSRELRQLADDVVVLDDADLRAMLSPRRRQPTVALVGPGC